MLRSKLRKAVNELRSDGDEDELADQVEKARSLIEEQKAAKKEQKNLSAKLEESTKSTIEGLTDQRARELLDAKWNRPIEYGIAALSRAEIDRLIDRVKDLYHKYETTFAEVDEQIRTEESNLSQMLGQLTGNDSDMAGIHELTELLGGEARSAAMSRLFASPDSLNLGNSVSWGSFAKLRTARVSRTPSGAKAESPTYAQAISRITT